MPRHAPLCWPRQSRREIRAEPAQHRVHGRRRNCAASWFRTMAPPFSGRDRGRHARSRARRAAQAHDLHERVRPRGAGSRQLLQARGRRDHRVSGRARTAAGQGAGQGRRRHCRPQRLALDLFAYRQRLSPGAARHRSSRRQGTGASATCCRISPRAIGPGSRRCARRSPTMPGCSRPGKDSTFQNKVHLALQAKGFFDKDETERRTDRCVIAGLDPAIHRLRSKMDTRVKPAYDDRTNVTRRDARETIGTRRWDSNAVSSDCPMSASRRCSTR